MGEKRGHYCVEGEMWDIDEDGYPTLVSGPSAVNACKAFLELFRDSDMRPEDECHVLYDAAKRSIDGAESDNANLLSQLTTAEAERDGYKARCEALEACFPPPLSHAQTLEKREILARQLKKIRQAQMYTLHCAGCSRVTSLIEARKCHWCGCWYCRECSDVHFGANPDKVRAAAIAATEVKP